MNVGYLLSKHSCDYMVIHDVDLLPFDDQLNYCYPDDQVVQVAAPGVHLISSSYTGGILLVNNKNFRAVSTCSVTLYFHKVVYTQDHLLQ